MSGGPVYRRATPADAEMLCALMSDPAVFGGLLQLPYPSADAWRKRLEEQVLQPAALHLLALDAHGATPAVIGSAGIHPIGPSQRQKHVGGMGICVAPAWQRSSCRCIRTMWPRWRCTASSVSIARARCAPMPCAMAVLSTRISWRGCIHGNRKST